MTEYPRIKEIGLEVHNTEYTEYIDNQELNDALEGSDLSCTVFNKYFGSQTCPVGGLYPWDCEAVLERMMSGKLTGSQKLWD